MRKGPIGVPGVQMSQAVGTAYAKALGWEQTWPGQQAVGKLSRMERSKSRMEGDGRRKTRWLRASKAAVRTQLLL